MKKLKVLLIILGSLAIIAGVVCAIVFSLPKGDNNEGEKDGTELLVKAPINNDTWISDGNFATKIDGKNISGRGIYSDPYKVYTAEGLAYFSYITNAGNYISSSTYIEIMNDIDLSAHYWVPISAKNINNQSIFMGSLNGNGHKIYGMFVGQQSSSHEYTGLIGYTSTGANIENLSIMTGEIKNDMTVIASGGVVGKMEMGTLKNVHSYINISKKAPEDIAMGGVVGDISSCSVINCSNYGNIKNSSGKFDFNAVGGLIGAARGDNQVRSSYNFGNLESYSNVGGLIGQIDKLNRISGTTLIVDCFNLGNINSIAVSSGLVGVCEDNLTINQSYNGGKIVGNRANGIAGVRYTTETSIKLVDVLNFGEVQGSQASDKSSFGILSISSSEGTTGNALIKNCYFGNADINASSLVTTGAIRKLNLRSEVLGQTFLNEDANWSMSNAWAHFKISEAYFPIPNNNVPNNWQYYAVKFSGDGSEKNPYQIASAQNLAYLAGISNVNNENFAGKYFVLTGNIDLSAHEWSPIAQENAFAGYLNGRNNEITNLNVFAKYSNVGLFAKIGKFENVSARIENLALKNVNIIGQENVGGISGYNNGGKIVNCKVDGKIVANNIAGGFIGNQIAGEIEKSKSKIQLLSVSGECLGGLIGKASSGTVLSSESDAEISSYGNKIGGLIGSANNFTIDKSFASVKIFGQENLGGFAGEITGESEITGSVVKGKIKTTSKNKVAGLVGSVSENTKLTKNVIIAEIQVANKIDINVGVVYSGEIDVSTVEGTYANVVLLDEKGNRIGKDIKYIYVKEDTNQEELFKDYFAFDKIDNLPAPAGVIGEGIHSERVNVLQILINKNFDMLIV